MLAWNRVNRFLPFLLFSTMFCSSLSAAVSIAIAALVLVIILWSVTDELPSSACITAPLPPLPTLPYTIFFIPFLNCVLCLCVGNLCLPSAKVETCCKHELLQLHHYHTFLFVLLTPAPTPVRPLFPVWF